MQSAVLRPAPDPVAVLTKAVWRASRILRLSQSDLAAVLGVSRSAVSNVATKGALLPRDRNTQELAKTFLRIFRSLDAIVGGDERVAGDWLRNHNTVLGRPPLEAMKTIAGIVHVMDYLDQRRAPL
ncbi:antitoxin Xre/MbcA/ParS toxin-binding domain-containing protein [Actibacterium sp. XHP0104]|uniref:antitoxin Xre/MbcA/ParS toxin-binding domain-containing protein n=1 Tax=Actibacterium sp. XHP0104 TaxID=2984335 RepID=UPI0021E752C9|nr:antitoxin Xre/MbcA/ParS toxin-binding domain-containing protein [Actibacterium sp. XHP0104]MCV2880555.1 DUF2384 domain-containing protein [Actibacterium sp. XHP0104]